MLTLFHAPGSCSDGILLLLEEVGTAYRVESIDLVSGGQRDPAFLAQNPKGKVPALLTDSGRVLTEFQSIAYWLAQAHPEAGLWPKDLDQQQRALEALDFIIASVHMRGFTFVRVPQKFQLDAKGTEDLHAYGRKEFQKGLNHLSEMLGDSEYLLGAFGIADAGAFYVLRWAAETQFDLAPNLVALSARYAARPAAKRAFG